MVAIVIPSKSIYDHIGCEDYGKEDKMSKNKKLRVHSKCKVSIKS